MSVVVYYNVCYTFIQYVYSALTGVQIAVVCAVVSPNPTNQGCRPELPNGPCESPTSGRKCE